MPTIRLDIEIDASKGTATLKQFAGEAEQATKKAGDAAKEGGKGFGQFASSLDDTAAKLSALLTPANLFGTVVGVAVIGALHNAIAATKDYALEMQRLQLVAGGTSGEIGELVDAANKTGIGADKLKRAFFFLSSEIESGGRNLAKFGISIRDSTGAQRESLEIFGLVGEKFRTMTSETERAVAARKLFTRGGADMLSLFELEAKQLKELGESGRLFEERFGKEARQGNILFAGSVSEVDEALTRMKITIITDIAPGLKLLADYTASAIDLFWKVPPSLRRIGEAVVAATVAFVGAGLAVKAFGVALAAANFGAASVALAGWAGPIALVAAALGALLILGPPLASVLASLLPQSVIDAWKSFAGWVSNAWTALKGYIGMAEAVKPPETQNADLEKTAAEMQIELGFEQRLLQAKLSLAKATQESTAYELLASQTRQRLALAELDIELKKTEIPVERAKLEATKTAIMAAGVAERNRLHAQEKIVLLDFDAEMEKLQISRTQTGEDAARNLAVVEQNAAFTRLKALQDNNAAMLSDQRAYDKAVLDSQVKLEHALTQIERERIAARIDYATKQNDIVTAQAQFQRDQALSGLEEEKKVLQDRFETYKISQTQLTDALIQIAEREKTAKLAFISEEVKGAIAAAALQRQKVEEQAAAGPVGEAKKAADIKAIYLNLYAELVKIGNREVEAEEGFTNKELELRRQAAKQAGILYAQEAGQIEDLRRKREQSLQNIGIVLENQARLAGDLGAAYQVGFAQAATAADDAFAVMKKSGADTFQALKSGLSDFLFDVLTGAKNIGDIFVNLGKRILRSMTDAFAEIIAKQAMMAAGFSLTSFLGIAGTAAAGFQGAPNQAAQAITGLGNAATESADALSGMTGILGLAVQALMFFANGLMGILSFFGQIVQGIASGGGIINTLTSAFAGLVKAGSLLSGVFSGLSSIGTVISSTLQGVGSLAAVFQSVFNAAGLTSGGFAAGPAVAGGTVGLVGGPGQFAQFAADWLPVAGALYSLATTIQSFFNGPLAISLGRTIGGAIGAVIGTMLGGPPGGFIGFSIGSFIGGFIGGLFAPTPKASLSATILPFNRNAMGSSTGMPGNTGTQVGRVLVNVGGNIMKNTKEDDLQLALAALLNKLLQDVVTATVGMLKILPPDIAAQLDAALTQLEATGLTIVDAHFRGGKAGKKFSSLVKGLMGEALQDLVKALNFGDVDLKALGFDPKDPKGKKGGEIARGFEALMTALAGLSAIVKAVGPAVTLAGVSLADFTKGALDLFKGFAQKGEPFIDTIKRVMQAFSEIIGLRDQVRASIVGLTKDLTEAVSIIKAQMATAETRMVALADALTVAIQSGAKPEDVLATAQAATKAVLDTLKMEIDAVTALHNAVKDLNASIASSVDFVISLTQKIDTLRGTSIDPEFMQTSIETITRLFGEITDVTLRISLFGSELVLLSESTGGILANIPLITTGFNTIMTQIQQMANPTDAVAALKGLAGAIDAGLQAGIAGINRQTQARIAALNVEREALTQTFTARRAALEQERSLISHAEASRTTALEAERALITENFNVQKQALQDQLAIARQWESVGASARGQLVSLFTLVAATHPLISLNEVRAQFGSAFAQFQAAPTATGATHVQDLAKQLLDLAHQTPGYDLPSAAFQGLATEIQAALNAIALVAEAQPTQEQIQAQIADLETQQAASLVSIDAQIAAGDAEQSAQLASIDAQIAALDAEQSAQLASIDAQIREANLAGQAQIQQLQALAAAKLDAIRAQLTIEITALAAQQALAAAALQAVLGDKTFEQFIVDKQAKAVDLLRSIDRTLQNYLGAIITTLFPSAGPVGTPLPAGTTGIEAFAPFLPHAQHGMDYVAQDGPVFLHRGERVLTASETRSFSPGSSGKGGPSVTINAPVTVIASGEVNARRLADQLEGELEERVKWGRLKAAISEGQRGQR